MPDEAGQPTEAELQAALEEQMRNIRVGDIVLQTTATLVNLGARRLGLTAQPGEDASDDVDLAEAKEAIDAARSLVTHCPDEQAEQIKAALSQLQMAYVQASGEGAPQGDAPAPAAETDLGTTGDEGGPDADRERARSKIWTPPGS